jgi:hypothetical protein
VPYTCPFPDETALTGTPELNQLDASQQGVRTERCVALVLADRYVLWMACYSKEQHTCFNYSRETAIGVAENSSIVSQCPRRVPEPYDNTSQPYGDDHLGA